MFTFFKIFGSLPKIITVPLWLIVFICVVWLMVIGIPKFALFLLSMLLMTPIPFNFWTWLVTMAVFFATGLYKFSTK